MIVRNEYGLQEEREKYESNSQTISARASALVVAEDRHQPGVLAYAMVGQTHHLRIQSLAAAVAATGPADRLDTAAVAAG